MESISAVAKLEAPFGLLVFSSFTNSNTTELAMGSIISVVAVFDIHMLMAKLASMNPNMMVFALVPVLSTMLRASLRCRFHFSIASAMRNPPRNRKTNRLLYVRQVFSKVITPSNGKSMMGNNEVMAMGTLSVIHQISIQATTPNTFA